MSAEVYSHDVFLSHSSEDREVVRPLAERLRQDGVRVWFEEWELSSGDSISTKIEKGLRCSHLLVVCMSATESDSYWARLKTGTFVVREPSYESDVEIRIVSGLPNAPAVLGELRSDVMTDVSLAGDVVEFIRAVCRTGRWPGQPWVNAEYRILLVIDGLGEKGDIERGVVTYWWTPWWRRTASDTSRWQEDQRKAESSFRSRIAEARANHSEKLVLNSSPLSDLSLLAELVELQHLSLGHYWSDFEARDIRPLVGLTKLRFLDLTGCWQLSNFRPLAGLTELRTLLLYRCSGLSSLHTLSTLTALEYLSLSECNLLSDLCPLERLSSLTTLHVGCCPRIKDLSPMAKLVSLRVLVLHWCGGVTDLSPLAGLKALKNVDVYATNVTVFPEWIVTHPSLEDFQITTLSDVPTELQSVRQGDNCLPRLRSWWRDKEQLGAVREPEVKVFLLGNGSVGKTRLARMLQGLPYDETVPTTHGVNLASIAPQTDPVDTDAQLNIWDFGGQDIYHGTHALFLNGGAVFCLLWDPNLEKAERYTEGQLEMRHRPLAYWIDYVRHLAGSECPVLIIQSKCDDGRAAEQRPADALLVNLPGVRTLSFSARTRYGTGSLVGTLRDAVAELHTRHPPPLLGRGWVAIRNQLRCGLAARTLRTMERRDFETLCLETGGVSDPAVLLEYLHRTGLLFHRPNLFAGKIIIDQSWALEAIYTVLDRKRCLPWLRGDGTFTRRELDRLVWRDQGFSGEEQDVLLSMMESCGICFHWRETTDGEWVWLAPELRPPRDAVRENLAGRLRESDLPRRRVIFRYPFLHEGIVRGLISAVGHVAKDAAVYWRNGLWLYERETDAYAVVEAREIPTAGVGAGEIELLVYGDRSDRLAAMLHKVIAQLDPPPAAIDDSAASSPPRLISPAIDESLVFSPTAPTPRGARPAVFVSYAWGDETPAGQQRAHVVEGLCERLENEGFAVQKDNRVMHNGESIRNFMKNFGTADHVVAVISDKYLRSPFCMAELYSVWQNCGLDPDSFQRRVHPIILDDAKIGTTLLRTKRARYWRGQHLAVEKEIKKLGVAVGETTIREGRLMAEFALHVAVMLAWLNDVLMPYGFENITKDKFSAVVGLLRSAK